jgi:3-methyladenine DNA glycosylase Tag
MKITTVYTRPNTNTLWWTEMPNPMYIEVIKPYYKEHFEDTGKKLSETFEISENGLELTHIAVWINDEEAFNEFTTDSVVNMWKQTREAYCYDVGIVKQSSLMQWRDPLTGEWNELIL